MSFGAIITYPFSWLLLNLYEFTANYGLSIILFAIIVKLILLPFQMKSKRSMMRSARLAPLMKELEKKHEGNKQKYQEEVARLYKEEHINPMSGCLWSLIPFPILLALYSVIRQPLTRMMRLSAEQVTTVINKLSDLGVYNIPAKHGAYYEINVADIVHQNFDKVADITDKLVNLDFSFLGMNLGEQPSWNLTQFDWSNSEIWAPALGLFLIPIVSALLSYFSMKISTATNPAVGEQQQGTMKGMQIMMPLVSLYICFIMPAALGIYWIANSVLAIIQDSILNRHYNKILDAEDAERRQRMAKREAELERKRKETEAKREMGITERNKNTNKKKIKSAEKVKSEEKAAIERKKEKERRRKELGITDDKPDSQVGTRRYARGRAYVLDRYTNPESAAEETEKASKLSDLDEQIDEEIDSEAQTSEHTAETENGEQPK